MAVVWRTLQIVCNKKSFLGNPAGKGKGHRGAGGRGGGGDSADCVEKMFGIGSTVHSDRMHTHPQAATHHLHQPTLHNFTVRGMVISHCVACGAEGREAGGGGGPSAGRVENICVALAQPHTVTPALTPQAATHHLEGSNPRGGCAGCNGRVFKSVSSVSQSVQSVSQFSQFSCLEYKFLLLGFLQTYHSRWLCVPALCLSDSFRSLAFLV
jgi:hypothetical protein